MANKQPIDYVLPGRAMGWENIKTRGGGGLREKNSSEDYVVDKT